MKKIKGYIAAVLSLCMVLAGSMTAFAAEAGQQPEEPVLTAGSARSFILPDYEDSLRTITRNDVNLRAEPRACLKNKNCTKNMFSFPFSC